jgi:hypothetical protein
MLSISALITDVSYFPIQQRSESFDWDFENPPISGCPITDSSSVTNCIERLGRSYTRDPKSGRKRKNKCFRAYSKVWLFLNNITVHVISPDLFRKTPKMLERYREVILFNKNLLISGTVSFLAGALVTQIYAIFDHNNLYNVIFTLTIGYCVYIPVFAFLFYRDNKLRYVDPITGKKNSKIRREDIIKLFGAFTVSEIIFIATKLYIHYSLLQLYVQPYQALSIAELTAWGVFLISINTGIKVVKLFK